MAQLNEKELKELVNKFGIFVEGDREKYDEVTSMLFNEQVEWKKNVDKNTDIFSYKDEINDHIWKLRVNNFPEEPMYTLFIDNKAVLTFDNMPENWNIYRS